MTMDEAKARGRQYNNMVSSRAIVAREPGPEHKPGKNWVMEDIMVPTDLGDGEVLVDMVASGICHTDLAMTSPGAARTLPIIAGHEGAGYVKAVGPNVKKSLKPGDPVLLSFDSCDQCPECQSRRPSYCDTFGEKNLNGELDVFRSKDGVSPIAGLVSGEDELKMFSPLGCGIQTGAGAVLNVAKPGPKDRVMVCGLGGVGLAAVMAARIAGCSQVIAVDKVQSRIDLAIQSFGATHGLNTTGVEDLPAAMKKIAGERGPSVVIETTGFPLVIESAYGAMCSRGILVQLGAPANQAYELPVHVVSHLLRGVKYWGSVEGDSYPAEFLPALIKYYREGKLPVEKMIKYYRAEDYATAIHDMHIGETIKPVLVW